MKHHCPVGTNQHIKFETPRERTKTAAIKNLFTAMSAISVVAFFLLPISGFAQTLNTSLSAHPPQVARDQSSTTAQALSDEFAGTYGTVTQNVHYGSATVSGGNDTRTDIAVGDEYFAQPSWTDVLTINNAALTGQAGVARLTMHLAGQMTGSWTGRAQGGSEYHVYVAGGYANVIFGGGITYNGPDGTPLSQLATFTGDCHFTYGSPLALYFQLYSWVQNRHSVSFTEPGEAVTSTDLTLSSGNFIVLNDQNQPVDFTAESRTGSARGSNILQGAPFNGFTLTNSAAPGRLGTTMSLLDGTASAATTLQAAFVAPPAPTVIKLVSDAMDFSGTGTDPVVIQMSYDPATARTLFGGEAGLRLGCELKGWFNALSGNTGGSPQFFPRAYNAATDFHVGNFGLDTAKHVVWAVVNHNSKYGVTVVPDPAGTVTPLAQLLNISTRMRVLAGDNVLIGGFIVTGTDPKKVIIRGIGPSLNVNGTPIPGRLIDPTLELHQPNGTVITNDNWKINDQTGQSQQAEIEATTIPPTNDLESAIVATLAPGNYTAILAGKNGGMGVGLVEVYDLAQGANSKLANISSRGFVDTNDNVMIGGFIVGGGTGNGTAKVIVRAIGPSLSVNGTPVPGRLADPTLELHDGSGTTIATNDNWKIDDQTGQSQEADIRATTVPPTNDLESALVASLAPGNYTAIVRGKNNTTGIAVVEAYNLQ